MKQLLLALVTLTFVLALPGSGHAAGAPGKPGTPTFGSITNSGFTASWTGASNTPTHYYVDVATDSGFSSKVVTGFDTGTTLSLAVTGLSAGTTYYVRVWAINGSGTGPYSTSANTVTVSPAPVVGTPTLPASAPYDTQFTAVWGATSGATSYKLDVATDSGFTSILASYSNKDVGNVTSVAVTGLTGGTQYFYRVRAYSSVNSSSSPSSGWASIYTYAPIPVPIAATNKNSTGFTANWNPANGATSYLLFIGTTSGGTQVANGTSVTGTTYDVSGLNGGTTYFYWLKSVDASGTNPTTPSSTPAATVVSALTAPGPPAVIGRTTSTATSVVLTWSPSTGATGYYIDVATDSGFTTLIVTNASTASTSYTVTGLTPGTDLYYRVRAYNASGTSASSGTSFVDFTAPTVLGISAGTSSSDTSPVDLTLSTLGGPYVRSTTPFVTVKFSEQVLGISYGTSIILKNNGTGVSQSIAAGYTPANNTTATPAGTPSQATFQPNSSLVNGTKYSVTITGGATSTTIHDNLSTTAANNNALTSPPLYYFTVDTSAPTISSITPVSGATGVGTTQNITIVFNENCVMDNRTYTSLNVSLVDSYGNAIATTLSSPSSPYTTLTITPALELAYNTTYTLTLSNIKDAAGNLLAGTGSYIASFTTRAASVTSYSVDPAFLSTPVTPNVLIILDNSNSMDETLVTGDAIGSFNCTDSSDLNSCSRSVLARKALIDLINSYAGKVNIGLMSYNLPSDTTKGRYLYNNYYFTSYDPRTFCGINPPPQACYDYCVNEDSTSMAACNDACQGNDSSFFDKGYTFNSHFQASIREPIITNVTNGSTAGSAKRKSYCSTIYPKTASYFDATNNVTLYHSSPGTMYSGSNSEGTRFMYSGNPPGSAYSPSDSATNTYYLYRNKAAASAPPYDGYVGYSNLANSATYVATDDDKALGFYNFGQAGMYYPPNAGNASPTWFSNSSASPAGGFLHVPIATNASDNVQLNKLLAKIGSNGFKNDSTGYMACGSTGASANRCSYIVNAGLTPTAGTLQSAIDYLNGNLAAAQTQDNAKPASPIKYWCQKTFVIYVTDGLASVDASGNTKDSGGNLYTAASLTYHNSTSDAVIDKINKLRCPSGSTAANCAVTQTMDGTNYNFDVRTYVLGLAISPQSSSHLDAMAVTGGTDINGKAYYANDATSLNNSLVDIFQNIFSRLSSGAAASILNNSEGSGALLLQALFYPDKTFSNLTSLKWSGDLLNLWYFVDPFFSTSTIHEDTDYTSGNHTFDTSIDKHVQFFFDDATKQTKVRRYNFDNTTQLADLDGDVSGGTKNLWSAGKLLWRRDLATEPRTIYTTLDGKTLTPFTTDKAGDFLNDLQVTGADATAKTIAATRIVNYVNGIDVCLDSSSPCASKSRNRTVTIQVSADPLDVETHVWKLGDIISSTPKLQSGLPLQSFDQIPPLGYSDASYAAYYKTNEYGKRGMVYVGSNDGMLHAFKLGSMNVKTLGTQRATLTGSNLGREEWAFIPRNVLPYLNYLADPTYEKNHLYLMDGTNALFDVATKSGTGQDDYWNEERTKDSWKTVLLGGMGLGGSSRTLTASCVDEIDAGTCVKTPLIDRGYSSYFALDVSNQDFTDATGNPLRAQPTLMWEFSHPELGYASSGPAMIRLNAKEPSGTHNPLPGKNGRWFAVYASGPTGPINTATRQFKGKSDQNLKLFIVDVEKGPVIDADPKKNGLWIIDTGIANAFGGSIANNAVVDAEVTSSSDPNLRQDDVVYIGYTKKASDGTWSDGGVLRLTIPDSSNPDILDTASWKTSRVIDGIGPVTTVVSKLLSKNNLYLFFGTGRYYYPQDDMSSTRRLFMVKEKCFPVKDGSGNYVKSDLIEACNETNSAIPVLALSNLDSRTTPSSAAVTNGWYIDLDAGERVVTDTVSTVNGAVFYTTYKPTSAVCGLGGKSYLWGVKYDTGDVLPSAARKGKVLIQLSTGSFAEMDLSQALIDKDGRRTGEASDLIYGKASADPGLFMTSAGLAPVKRIMHIQERFK